MNNCKKIFYLFLVNKNTNESPKIVIEKHINYIYNFLAFFGESEYILWHFLWPFILFEIITNFIRISSKFGDLTVL